jgi:ATP citrate (pro-S)-lyase
MSAKSILEADGKAILNYHLTRAPSSSQHLCQSPQHTFHHQNSHLFISPKALPYPQSSTKPNQHTLAFRQRRQICRKARPADQAPRQERPLALNKTWPEAREWIEARAGKEQQVETVKGVLRQFLVEPFVPHPEGTEYYVNINSVREVCCLLSFLLLHALRCSHMAEPAVVRIQSPDLGEF